MSRRLSTAARLRAYERFKNPQRKAVVGVTLVDPIEDILNARNEVDPKDFPHRRVTEPPPEGRCDFRSSRRHGVIDVVDFFERNERRGRR